MGVVRVADGTAWTRGDGRRSRVTALLPARRRPKPTAAIVLMGLVAWYLLATLPYLADFPVIEWAQSRIMEPAYKLAVEGTYGNDLLTGFFASERRYYEFMPLYPLQIALAFRLLGVGIWQARFVSVMGGLLTVVLTYRIGQRLHGTRVGLVAAAALCGLKVAVPVPGEVERIGINLNASGVPLLDMARLVRYDLWVPVWLLAACLCFFRSERRRWRFGFLLAGALVGLGTLTHVYAVFLVAVLAGVHLWHHGRRTLKQPELYLLGVGWLLPLLPWAIYVMQDPTSYVGQMLKHEANYHLLSPLLYVTNLLREPWRYLSWAGGSFRHPILWPRLGVWVLVAGLIVGSVVLWDRVRRAGRIGERFTLAAWPALAFLLGAFIAYKRYYYVLLPLPFMAVQVGIAVDAIWREATWRPTWTRALLGMILAVAALEGAWGVYGSMRAARTTTPYNQLMAAVRRAIPDGTRLLLAESYWLPLADHEVRSIQLPFLLSNKRYYAQPPSMEQVLLDLQPEYVVSEERLLDLYARDPDQANDNAQDWRLLDAYLRQHCPNIVADLPTVDQGRVKVYECAYTASIVQ